MMIITIFEQYNRAMRLIVSAIIILLMLHAFSSCSTAQQIKLDPQKSYKMELYFEEGKLWGNGMIWLPKQLEHNITVIADETINLLSFRSCSREVIVENPKSWMKRNKFIYNYVLNRVEQDGACPIMVSAVNKTGMRQAGYIELADDVTTLPATIVCGELTEKTYGVNVCQERIDSIERIYFDTPVIVEAEKGCEMITTEKGKSFTWKMKKGFCSYHFAEMVPPYRIARLTTHGYDMIDKKL